MHMLVGFDLSTAALHIYLPFALPRFCNGVNKSFTKQTDRIGSLESTTGDLGTSQRKMSTETFTQDTTHDGLDTRPSGSSLDPDAFTTSQAQEESSTRRIREKTRAAVDQFRSEHPPRSSGASSSDRTAANGSEDPPDGEGRFTKAGMIATGAGQGGAAKAHLAQGSGRGWEGVEVPDKHGLMSPHLKTERKKVLKVSPT